MKKTNAIRLLDANEVVYETVSYDYQNENLSVTIIAEQNRLPIESIYKTLVLKGDKSGVIIALVPGDQQLIFKVLAKLSGNKKVTTVAVKELQGLTGYVRGGCSPLGMKKNFPVYIDQSVEALDQVLVNAGAKGLLVQLAPQDLISLTNAKIGYFCSAPDS